MLLIGDKKMPIHLDASNVRRLTISQTDRDLIISIEDEEGIHFLKAIPVGSLDAGDEGVQLRSIE